MSKAERMMLRLEPRMKDLIDARAKHHGVSVSEYMRGLVCMESLLGGMPVDSRDVPDWMLRAYPIGFLKEARKKIGKHKVIGLLINLNERKD